MPIETSLTVEAAVLVGRPGPGTEARIGRVVVHKPSLLSFFFSFRWRFCSAGARFAATHMTLCSGRDSLAYSGVSLFVYSFGEFDLTGFVVKCVVSRNILTFFFLHLVKNQA